MAKISLRAYQNKLDSLLEANQFDEVIAHSRHILKTCPKNLRAYQQLGAALFAASRWEEAAEMLRRLLGALPQDFEAHAMLARACQQLQQYDKAIWHAERAFDQQPNSQDIISLIRRLYREYRGQEIERLPLTASALAQQHIRSSQLDEAISVLDSARQRHPNRIDLQLLQARVLWLAGRRADAAETALEILTRLPYSRTANRIMTELWLSEQRPSDAEPYLSRIEELDPYLAYQLASGEAPTDSLVTLEELDAAAIPPPHDAVDLGWLDGLEDADDAADQSIERGGIEASGLEALFGMDEPPAPPAAADLEDLLADSELESLFNELNEDTEADESATDKRADFEADESDSAAADETPTAADETEPDLTQLLERLDSDERDSSWLSDIQQGNLEADDPPPPAPPEESETEATPPEAEWIEAAARGMTAERGEDFDLFADDEQLQTLLGKVNETQPIHPDDIEFWLNSTDSDFDDADAPTDEKPDETDDLDVDDLTDKSWLDDEFEDDFAVDDEPTLDLIDDWQSELDDGADDTDDDYIDWLNEDDPPPSQPEPAEALQAAEAAAPEPAEESTSSETARAWGLKDAEQLADFVDDEVELTEAEAAPDWLNAMAPGLDGGEDADDPAPAQSAPSSTGDFAWLNDIVDEETSEMKAVAPEPMPPTAPRFDFSQPPAWMAELLAAAPPNQEIAAAGLPLLEKLSADETGDELNLDALDLELGTDDFDFDAPTEKIIPIGTDDEDISIDELDFDDYFDFDAPTEKITAVSADELDDAIAFAELGLEDEDFDFDAPTEKIAAVSADDATDELDFEAFEADSDLPPPAENGLPEWLEYDDAAADDSDFDFSDPDKKTGRSSTRR